MSSFQRPDYTYHCYKSAYEAEIDEVIWVDAGGGVDLQAVVAVTCIFKQTVHGIQHIMRQMEKPLPETQKKHALNSFN